LAANTRMIITELDFDAIKSNLIAFMRGQSTFSDYDFLGSGLQVLINELAYNTHYGAYFVNMVANEMFISTAIVRDNIIKLAEQLGYTPRSIAAPTAIVNVIVTPENPETADSSLLLPRFTSFLSSAKDGINYNFVTTQGYTALLTNNKFTFENVEIKEGDVVSYTYTADTVTNPTNLFEIPNANIDTSTLLVNVTRNSISPPTTNTFILTRDTSILTGNSEVYFLKGSDNNRYTLSFGDNILGRSLVTGDQIDVTYLLSHGDIANYANNFVISGSSLGGYSNVSTRSISASTGGRPRESNDEIKRNAPQSYSTQERAVTIQDYEFLLNRDYSNIGSLSIWGGDQNDPKIFGRVFIAIKPQFGNYLSTLEKTKVVNLLKKYNMPTVQPIVVDPDYTYLLVNLKVNYDPSKTSLSESQLKTNIRNAIITYGNNYLGKFDGTYRESILYNNINTVDPSILGISARIFLQKRFSPKLNQKFTYLIDYKTALHRGGLLEKLYSFPGFFAYDNFGNLRNCFLEENIGSYQGITSISISDPGFSYTSTPTVEIIGDGTGATATAIIKNGSLSQIIVDNPGEGYSYATVYITDGGGYNGSAIANLQSLTGEIRAFYIDLSNKYYLPDFTGEINYSTGKIVLNNLTVVDIDTPDKTLTVNIKPDNSFIVPEKNTILYIDQYDPKSITITMVPQIIT
jgi:hypothetical protein